MEKNESSDDESYYSAVSEPSEEKLNVNNYVRIENEKIFVPEGFYIHITVNGTVWILPHVE